MVKIQFPEPYSEIQIRKIWGTVRKRQLKFTFQGVSDGRGLRTPVGMEVNVVKLLTEYTEQATKSDSAWVSPWKGTRSPCSDLERYLYKSQDNFLAEKKNVKGRIKST